MERLRNGYVNEDIVFAHGIANMTARHYLKCNMGNCETTDDLFFDLLYLNYTQFSTGIIKIGTG